MGDIVRPGRVPMRLQRGGHRHRADRARRCAARQRRSRRRSGHYAAADLGRRVRVLWQGAEYRGRGRETLWNGKLTVSGNRIARFAPVNFLNPERKVTETAAGDARLDLGDDRQSGGHRSLARRARTRARSASKPTSCRARSTSPRSPTRRSRSTAADLDGSSASIACRRTTGAAAHARTHGDVFRRRRPAGLAARHAGRRQSGLDQPDLPDRVIRAANQAFAGVATGEASRCRMSTSSACAGEPRSLKASIGFASVSRLSRVSRRIR